MISSRRKTGKDTAQTKEMMRKEKVTGYEEFQKALKDLYIGEKPPQINLLFTGEKNNQGISWCPDCNNAEPHISKALNDYAKRTSIFVEVDVGNRETAFQMSFPYIRNANIWKRHFKFTGNAEQIADLKAIHLAMSLYRDRENPFRKDKDVRIQEIPTLVRWNTPFRLEGEQCAKPSLLEMFFGEPSEED